MLHHLLATLPKAVVFAISSSVIVGASAAAAATAGGGEVPAPVHAVFSALGFGLDNLDAGGTPTPGKGKAARATATGTAAPGKDLPSPSSIPGLCRAYLSGSENGREQKLEAPAFRRLQNAANAAGAADLETYCSVRAASPTATPAATASAGATQGALLSKGDAGTSEAKGKSEEHRSGYSPVAIIAGATPATKGKSEDHGPPAAPVASGSGVTPKGKANGQR